MPKRQHHYNKQSKQTKHVSETTALTTLTDNLLQSDIQFYKYQPNQPVFLHKKELQEIVSLIVDRTKNLVIGDNQLEEYTKRGNIITKINKTIDELKSQRTRLHREAKASYQTFDEEMGNMIDQLTNSRLALKEQVDNLQEQQRQIDINNLEKEFNNLKNDFLKNDNTNTPYNVHTFEFANWFGTTNAKLRLSHKKAVEDITQYISSQAKDYQTFINLINKDLPNKEVLSKVFNENYTGNASEAYTTAQNKLLELEQLERMRRQQEEQRQQRALEYEKQQQLLKENDLNNSTTPVKPTDSSDNTSMVGEAKVGYVFTLYNPVLAKQLKSFMEEKGMQFDFETKPL